VQNLDIISVNLWQILISLANLVIIFLIVKKFLYKPVMVVLQTRREKIDREYSEAADAKQKALADREAYEEKLAGAKAEADIMIQSAVGIASQREKEILAQAKVKADGIVKRAEEEAKLEHKRAEDSIKKEIVEVSSLLTEKMLEREVSVEDHKKLIDSFIDNMGDE